MFAHPRKGTGRSSTLPDREAVDAIPASTSAESRSKFSRFAVPPPSVSSMGTPTTSRSSPKVRPSSSLLASPVSKSATTTGGAAGFGRVFGTSSMGPTSSSTSTSTSSEATSTRDQIGTGGTGSLIRPRPFMQASSSGAAKAGPDSLPGIMSGFGRFKSSFFSDGGNMEASSRMEDASIPASIPGIRAASAADGSSSEGCAGDRDARVGAGRRKTNMGSVGTTFQGGSATSSPERNREASPSSPGRPRDVNPARQAEDGQHREEPEQQVGNAPSFAGVDQDVEAEGGYHPIQGRPGSPRPAPALRRDPTATAAPLLSRPSTAATILRRPILQKSFNGSASSAQNAGAARSEMRIRAIGAAVSMEQDSNSSTKAPSEPRSPGELTTAKTMMTQELDVTRNTQQEQQQQLGHEQEEHEQGEKNDRSEMQRGTIEEEDDEEGKFGVREQQGEEVEGPPDLPEHGGRDSVETQKAKLARRQMLIQRKDGAKAQFRRECEAEMERIRSLMEEHMAELEALLDGELVDALDDSIGQKMEKNLKEHARARKVKRVLSAFFADPRVPKSPRII